GALLCRERHRAGARAGEDGDRFGRRRERRGRGAAGVGLVGGQRRAWAVPTAPRRVPLTVGTLRFAHPTFRHASVCTITGPAIAFASPTRSGPRFWSIQASARRLASSAPAKLLNRLIAVTVSSPA